MTFLLRILSCACLALLGLSAPLSASPQDLDQIKARLQQPPGPKLAASQPIEPRPVFKSSVERHPWVLTLDQTLHRDFDLNDFQRQSANWRSKCCGLDLGQLFDAAAKAHQDAHVSKVRAQIRRELADLASARAAAAAIK